MLVLPNTNIAKITRPLRKLTTMNRMMMIDHVIGYFEDCYSSRGCSVQ